MAPLGTLGDLKGDRRVLTFERSDEPALEGGVLHSLHDGHRIERITEPVNARRIGEQCRIKIDSDTCRDGARIVHNVRAQNLEVSQRGGGLRSKRAEKRLAARLQMSLQYVDDRLQIKQVNAGQPGAHLAYSATN